MNEWENRVENYGASNNFILPFYDSTFSVGIKTTFNSSVEMN